MARRPSSEVRAREAWDTARFRAQRLTPYFSRAIWRMQGPYLRELLAAGCPGAIGVDAQWRVYLDPSAIGRWSVVQIASCILHEALHCILGHSKRRGRRDPARWNVAADLEVDSILHEVRELDWPYERVTCAALGMPRGRTAEEYYALLGGDEELEEQQQEQQGKPSAAAEDEEEGAETDPSPADPDGGASGDCSDEEADDGDHGAAEGDDSSTPGRDPGDGASSGEGGGDDGDGASGEASGGEDGHDPSSPSGSPAASGGSDEGASSRSTGSPGAGRGDGASSRSSSPSGAGDADADADGGSGRPRGRPRDPRGRGTGSASDGVARPWEGGADTDADGSISEAERDLVRRQVAEEFRRTPGRGTGAGGLERWVDAILAPARVPWRQVLRGIVRGQLSRAGVEDYSYARPSRRASSCPRVVLPAMRAPAPTVGVVLDTSGSMGDEDVAEALAEVEGICRAVGAEIRALSCDASVSGRPTVARRVRDLARSLVGGGGTNMGVGIAAFEAETRPPQVVVVLTDGDTPWPPAPPRDMRVVVVLVGEHHSPLSTVPSWARGLEVDHA